MARLRVLSPTPFPAIEPASGVYQFSVTAPDLATARRWYWLAAGIGWSVIISVTGEVRSVADDGTIVTTSAVSLAATVSGGQFRGCAGDPSAEPPVPPNERTLVNGAGAVAARGADGYADSGNSDDDPTTLEYGLFWDAYAVVKWPTGFDPHMLQFYGSFDVGLRSSYSFEHSPPSSLAFVGTTASTPYNGGAEVDLTICGQTVSNPPGLPVKNYALEGTAGDGRGLVWVPGAMSVSVQADISEWLPYQDSHGTALYDTATGAALMDPVTAPYP